jgi:L-threonylcarbamoyladenylate synthase
MVNPDRLEAEESRAAMEQAAHILRAGGLVALPTETVYGLGANALDADAVMRIFAAKERPSWDPVIVHVAGPVQDNAMVAVVAAEIADRAQKLMDIFWPGPLTLLLPRSSSVPDAVTAGRALVGVRMPAHPVAFELIKLAGVPVAAPSANLFAHISPTSAEHVLHDLDGRIDAVLDAGPATHGVESTVLDPNQSPMVIYRPGTVSADQIRAVAGDVIEFKGTMRPAGAAEQGVDALPSPGVGIRHYAPRARLILVDAAAVDLAQAFLTEAERHRGQRVGWMLPTGWKFKPSEGIVIFEWGPWDAPEELAAKLYAGLRALDAAGCQVIVCPVPQMEGIGAAIRDRLHKAAWNET